MPPPTLSSLTPSTTVLRLPHPYHTPYAITKSSHTHGSDKTPLYQLGITSTAPSGLAADRASHAVLHNDAVFFTEPTDLKSSDRPHESNNTPWGRARRSPSVTALWDAKTATLPTPAQLWLLAYLVFTVRPGEEAFRLTLVDGTATAEGPRALGSRLKDLMLAIDHPVNETDGASSPTRELLVLRSTFWQGAGSPFGPRPVWAPDEAGTSAYPLAALDGTLTAIPGTALCWHPRRPAKPRPGSVVYSRYVPHLAETFSMVALDWTDDKHLALFHTWQNDPRVSQGWNETGTLDQHREYLRKLHEDPHQFAVLAAFEGVFFAYFEIYWAKEDRLGAYYQSGDFDRGRHSLVGDVRFRGPHRVSAWWSSLMHFLYLDEPRTTAVVGEPKSANSTVLSYDFIHGFGVEKFVDLPHKRSGLMHCSRERFFQLCPLAENDKVVGGTGVGLVPKL
ncbi:hypothetical protein MCOR25_007032 [Pyricularia grisea]|nr:hypothetical protein MCOR25_007032 [Pyricularia grisea]